MASPPVTRIGDDRALADFRRGLTGQRAIEMLDAAAGRLLVQLAVGVGKTRWLLEIIRYAVKETNRYDLVLVLAPRWDILREMQANLPADMSHTMLEPRPQKRCGYLNSQWFQYEKTGCGLLGRKELCATCPQSGTCHWPNQYGEALDGKRLILTTHQHLIQDPHFVQRIKGYTKAERPLLLVDESDLVLKNCERVLQREELQAFASVVAEVDRTMEPASGTARRWAYLTDLIRHAPTHDLQTPDWWFPSVHPDWAIAVQQLGRRAHGDEFRFLGYDLVQFGHSDASTREHLPNGDVRYAAIPDLGREFVVFSGSISRELARFRIDPGHREATVHTAFEDIVFKHDRTQWFNISSTAGAARNFHRNMPQILYFFAAKIAENIRLGRRTLLVARKRFVPSCVSTLQTYLAAFGLRHARIITGDWEGVDLHDPTNVCLVHYGISGVNCFEHFDCAYCLTGYYVNENVLTKTLNDLATTDCHCDVSIKTEMNPPRRTALVQLPDDQQTILPIIAQGVLEQVEADRIVQAVGRVRPFTLPREVITFHAGELPGVQFDLDFRSPAAARNYFGIQPRRLSERDARAARAVELRQLRLTQRRIAAEIGVSVSTVKRYLRDAKPSNPIE